MTIEENWLKEKPDMLFTEKCHVWDIQERRAGSQKINLHTETDIKHYLCFCPLWAALIEKFHPGVDWLNSVGEQHLELLDNVFSDVTFDKIDYGIHPLWIWVVTYRHRMKFLGFHNICPSTTVKGIPNCCTIPDPHQISISKLPFLLTTWCEKWQENTCRYM